MKTKDDWVTGGYSILPVIPGEKRPLISWKVFQNVKANPEDIARWWRENNNANVGLVCGQINNLVVLDCDSSEANELARGFGLPETVSVKTPRGNHYYFGINGNETVQTVPQGGLNISGCEIRGEGSYVLVPPSIVGGREYTWVRELGSLPLAPFSSLPVDILGSANKASITQRMPLPDLLSGVSEGGRNSSLARLVGSSLHYFDVRDVLHFALFANSRYSPPLPEGEVFSIVKSITDRHQKKVQKIRIISEQALLRKEPVMNTEPIDHFLEKGNGGQEYLEDGFVSYQGYEGEGTTKDDMIRIAAEEDGFVSYQEYGVPYHTNDDMIRMLAEEKERWRPKTITALQIPSDIKWYVKGYITTGLVTELVGMYKAGKTTFIVEMIKAITEGTNFLGEETEKARVLIVTEETETEWALRQQRYSLNEEIKVISQPFMLKPGGEQWIRFIEHVSRLEYDIVVIDSLANLWPVEDENHSSLVVKALQPLKLLTRVGKAVLVVHHVRKTGGTEGRASRGAGSLPAYVDIIVEFTRYGKKETQRLLTGYSRRPETPREVIIDYVEKNYVLVEERKEVSETDRKSKIIEKLNDFPDGLTREELIERLGGESNYDYQTIWRDLQTLLQEKRVVKKGDGVRGNPYIYFIN